MSISLHNAVVGTYRQILPGLASLVTKAEEYCRTNGMDDPALTEASLADGMWPFSKQIFASTHHSARAIEGVRAGIFTAEVEPVPSDFGTLHKEAASAIATIEAVQPDELDAIADRDMFFRYKEIELSFTVSEFLLSFSLPNFYFHVATAYDILRNQGVPLSKRDFLGQMRMKS